MRECFGFDNTLVLDAGSIPATSTMKIDKTDKTDKHMTINDPTDWQPIETAPEGDYILMWVPGPSGTEIRAGYYWGWWECALTVKEVKPTHWMPLPEPPTEDEREQP